MSELTDNIHSNISLVSRLSKECFPDNPVLADLTLCQAILEAGLEHSPPSSLALLYNNLFGIKGVGTGKIINGQRMTRISLSTKEYYHGVWSEPTQGFAVNNSVEDSLEQHYHLFDQLDRYQNLWDCKTFEDAANIVRLDGYATDPGYTHTLISIHTNWCKHAPGGN